MDTNEWDDVLLTLQLAHWQHGTGEALKAAARQIRLRVKGKTCFDFLTFLQRSPLPMQTLMKELKSRRPADLELYDATVSASAGS